MEVRIRRSRRFVAQYDVLFTKNEEKPKRRGWIGTTTYFGNNHGDYVKSLRILQFIFDTGIYLAIPGSYIFDISSWYKVFSNLYAYFPYPCFSIQFNIMIKKFKGALERILHIMKIYSFCAGYIEKSLYAIGNKSTPSYFKNGMLNIIAIMYTAVNEEDWFKQFNETIFEELLKILEISKILIVWFLIQNTLLLILGSKKMHIISLFI